MTSWADRLHKITVYSLGIFSTFALFNIASRFIFFPDYQKPLPPPSVLEHESVLQFKESLNEKK